MGRALGPLERVSLSHALLASLPVREAATTNYDDLFERALRAAGRTLSVLPYEAAESDAWLLKLHGSLRPGGDIVLTRDDYLRYAERRAALAGIVQALLITRHMLFVGFSLEDDNFHRVAHDVRRAMTSAGGAGGAFGTALFLRPEPMLAELWSGQIDFAPVAPPGDSEATRRLELFLDALVADASDVAGHLLDAAYAGLLSAEERRLRDRLRDLAAGAGQDERDTPAWARVEALLEDLGGPAGDRRPSGGAGPAGMNGSSMDPPPPPVVEGEGLRLRLATAADLPAMLQIIAEPEVAPWWPLWVPAEEELLGPDHATYVIEAGGGPGGILMVSEDPTPGYRSAGMDIAVSGRLHGRRVGRRALVAMARHLFEERGHHRLTIDPAAANARAVHAYRSIGFRPVGTMRAYERGPDGEWRDGLLMDMLAGELTSP